jgi:hypothetical protein
MSENDAMPAMKTPLDEIPPVEVTPGEALDAAVAAFEADFASVEDKYMHQEFTRTEGGTRFRRVIPGTPDVTKLVPYQDYATCAADWLQAARQVRSTMVGKQLLWRIRPHFVVIPAGGFTIESAFAVEAVAAPASDDPKHDAPAFSNAGTAKAASEE